MDWFRVAVIILVILKTIEFAYRFFKWFKNKKKIRTLKNKSSYFLIIAFGILIIASSSKIIKGG